MIIDSLNRKGRKKSHNFLSFIVINHLHLSLHEAYNHRMIHLCTTYKLLRNDKLEKEIIVARTSGREREKIIPTGLKSFDWKSRVTQK
jgi:hypothetical protein